ncbi:hypothetical protein D3C75_760590 [compost metagenome]
MKGRENVATVPIQVHPVPWQGLRAFIAHEGQHLLAHLAAQVEGHRGVLGAGQATNLGHPRGDVRDLQGHHVAVPQGRGVGDGFQLDPQSIDRRFIVHIEEGDADQAAVVARPVLERLLDEIGQRQDHPPPVPQLDHDIGRGDLLAPPPLALDDDGVVQSDGLGRGDLDAGDQVGQEGLQRQTGDDADHAGRGQQRQPPLAHARNGQQG